MVTIKRRKTKKSSSFSSNKTLPTCAESSTSYFHGQRNEKIEKIIHCIEKRDVDLWALRELALTRGGLINAKVRQKAWHKLVNIDLSSIGTKGDRAGGGGVGGVNSIDSREMDLIRRDVGRSVLFRYSPDINKKLLTATTASFETESTGTACSCADSLDDGEDTDRGASSTSSPNCSPGSGSASAVRDAAASAKWDRENLLASLVVSALLSRASLLQGRYDNNGTPTKNNDVSTRRGVEEEVKEKSPNERQQRRHYYQGFHDVATVFLINLHPPLHLASAVLRRIVRSHLRDATREDFGRITTLLDMVFFPLIQVVDEKMHDFLKHSEVEPTVILPWLVTWFAHDVHDEEIASRLFDAFIASHPLMPLYFAVALIVHPFNREKIFCSECDPATVHIAIKELTSGISSDWIEGNEVAFSGGKSAASEDVLTSQDLIDDAISFMRKVPPKSLVILSKRYDQGALGPVLKRASTISLLKSPPTWALASAVPSDRVQRLQARQKTSRRNGNLTKSYLLKASSMDKRLSGQKSTAKNDKAETNVMAKIASGVSSLVSSDADFVLRGEKSASSTSGFSKVRMAPVLAKSMLELFGKLVVGIQTSSNRKMIEN